MKIAINGYFLTRPYTGLGNHTRGLLTALDSLEHRHELVVCVPEKVDFELTSMKIMVVDPPKYVGASLAKFWWEQWKMPQQAKKDQVNLIHHFYPATSILTSIPQITSIHDATPWHFPEHNYSRKVRWFRQFTLKASRKAMQIVTVSESAKEDVAKIFNLPESRISVIYNGVEDRFRGDVTEKDRRAILEKYGISFPYIFYIGGFEVHKNVRKLFFAFAKAASEIDEHLVVAGGVFSKTRPPVYKDFYELPKLIDNYKLHHRVHLIGPVPSEELPALYQRANLFASSSMAEGFNIPLVEAMASGTPIICSDIAVNQEIAIDHAGHKAAMFVDTKDETAFARAIVKLLNDKQKQKELIANAWKRQKEFTWGQAGQKLIDVYDAFESNHQRAR